MPAASVFMPSIVKYFVDRVFGIPIAYTKEDIRERSGKLWLKIGLGGRRFLLPLVDVGDTEPLAIAYFNPKPEINHELSLAAAKAMSGFLQKLHPKIIVKAPSEKSGPFIDTAVVLLNYRPKIVQLIGNDNRAVVEKVTRVDDAKRNRIVEYIPVTRIASRKPKYLGIMPHDRRDVARLTPNGHGLVIADDVYTTGATVAAIAQLLEIQNFSVSVIARESPLNDTYPPHIEKNMKAVMHLPEIREIAATKLFPIEPKAAIPAAIVL